MKNNENKSQIPVVIFVGGYGSRLKEETQYKPKPMVEVGGYPILWHIMKIYAHHKFMKFILPLGYKGDYITTFINEHPKLFNDFEITSIDTGLETPTGGRLLKVADQIKTDTFMCTYGDGVSDVDISALYDYHNTFTDIVGTITAVKVPHRFGII